MGGAMLAQILPFVHPGLAWAALGTGLIPIVIHLINRRRHRRVPWAAMSFLLAANRRRAHRMRLEQFLLMAVRIAVVLLAGLAVARPFLSDGRLSGLVSSRVHCILLIDNSLSMQARRPDGTTRFDAALAVTERLVSSFGPEDGVSIVTLSAPARAVIGHASFDRRFVRDQTASLRVTQRPTDTAGGLEAALQIVRESAAALGNRVVYVISDFSSSIWQSDSAQNPTASARKAAELAAALAHSESDLNFVRIDPGTDENVAITRIAPETPLIGLHVPARFVVEATNFGSTTARGAVFQVRREGQIIRRQLLPVLAPGESATIPVGTEFSTPGTKIIEARLTATQGDALAADDARYLSVDVRESTPVLLVDGRPGSKLLDGQAGFLAMALAPRPNDDPSHAAGIRRSATLVDPKVISEPELAAEALSQYDVIALCNVAHLTLEQWARLQDYVSAGGGLLVALGELVSSDHYNRFGFADGKGLLPGRLGRPTEAKSGSGEHLGFKLDPHPHPLVAEFAGHATSGLFLARVDRYVPISAVGHRGEVILRYTDDEPAMVASSFGSGRVIVWTTTINMEWNNLPGKGDYVPVMLNAVASLVARHGEHRNLLVGQTLREPLSPAESSMPMRVVVAENPSAEPAVVSAGSGLAAEYGPLEAAQPISFAVGGSVRQFAVNVDITESDLRTTEAAELRAAVGRPIRMMDEREAGMTSVAGSSAELSSALLLVVLALLAGEIGLAHWFGTPHPPRERAIAGH